MHPLLKSDPETIRESFAGLKSRRDIAHLLEVSDQTLIWHLYRHPPHRRYREFALQKLSGGTRRILAPVSRIRLLQAKLNAVLQIVAPLSIVSHGFVKGRSIRSNADVHCKRRWVLNIDIENFFPAINFGRVRGLFMAHPFKLPPPAATVLAQLCCFENELPQGAPSSPIVANLVCLRLDAELRRLAKSHRCYVTRYADDITFSTGTDQFPPALASVVTTASSRLTVAGPALINVIAKNGFQLNSSKARLMRRTEHQEVTGLTVNVRPNVRRGYVTQLGSMMHAWEKFGYAAAEQEWQKKFDHKRRIASGREVSFKRALSGRLAFLQMVKGANDPVVRRLRLRLDRLVGTPSFTDAVWVIEGDHYTGTGFVLRGHGFITCDHVLDQSGDIVAFRASQPDVRYPVVPRVRDHDSDVAVCEVPVASGHSLDVSLHSPTIGLPIRVVGYPNWNEGNSAYVADGKITALKKFFSAPYALVSAQIIAGNSGGPVLDDEGRVVGVARTGDRFIGDPMKQENGVILVGVLEQQE